MDPEKYFSGPNLKPDVLVRLQKDARAMAKKGDDRQVHLTFVGDVYQPLKPDEDITRAALEILIDHGLQFTILTKGGRRALRDFDLLAGYPKASFGTISRVCEMRRMWQNWEPGAATVKERSDVIRIAHRATVFGPGSVWNL